MPLSPIAWFFAIFFFALLIADIVFGFTSAGWGGAWTLWGPILAVAISWVIGLVGGLFSIVILRIVKFLSVLYLIGFVILAVAALVQGSWATVGIAVVGAIATMFAGGFLIMVEQAMIRQSIEQKLAAGFQEL